MGLSPYDCTWYAQHVVEYVYGGLYHNKVQLSYVVFDCAATTCNTGPHDRSSAQACFGESSGPVSLTERPTFM